MTARADELYRAQRDEVCRRTDRLFVLLMLVQWAVGVVAALGVSPRAWGPGVGVWVHVWVAMGVGGAIAAVPVVLVWRRPGAAATRHVIAAAQMLFGALLIHLTEGRIETHFHIFGSLAFLAAYRDWRVLVTASAVVAVDHIVRGAYWPRSVYGVDGGAAWRWVEDTGWVVFEGVFLWVAMRQSLAETRAMAERQAEVEAAKEEIEAASRAKSAFLAHMSHEIRTPMTAILGYADLMDRGGAAAAGPAAGEEEIAEYVRTIRRNGEHLLTILNDILDMSKIEAGKLSVERVECSPVRVVDEVMSVMRPRAVEKGLRFAVEYRTAVPRTMRSDPTRVRQVLINLASNAIKFTDRGEVRVGVGMAGDRLRFEVADTGMGMTPEQVGRLFEPFAQGDGSTSRRFGGTGLGLSISRRLAELLGGGIEVTSEPGRGSTFRLSLPVDTAGVRMVRPELEAAALVERIERSAASAGATGDVVRGRVLLADDAADNRRLLQRLLERAGLDVDLAENGRVAVEKALSAGVRGERYDVVLMDMQMPEMDGYEASTRLRARGYRGAVVALTAHASEQDRDKCLRAGCDDYLAKPFDMAKLLELVGRHTGKGEEIAAEEI